MPAMINQRPPLRIQKPSQHRHLRRISRIAWQTQCDAGRSACDTCGNAERRGAASAEKAQRKRACIAAGPFGMADSGGFEPPTARFVAEYSIQLSYESGSVILGQSP